MYNYFMLIGKICNDIEVKEYNGQKVVNLNLAVKRPFKSSEGEYDTDFINVSCWNGSAETIAPILKKGQSIGVKGRIQPRKLEIDGKTYVFNDLIAEKIIFV